MASEPGLIGSKDKSMMTSRICWARRSPLWNSLPINTVSATCVLLQIMPLNQLKDLHFLPHYQWVPEVHPYVSMDFGDKSGRPSCPLLWDPYPQEDDVLGEYPWVSLTCHPPHVRLLSIDFSLSTDCFSPSLYTKFYTCNLPIRHTYPLKIFSLKREELGPQRI